MSTKIPSALVGLLGNDLGAIEETTLQRLIGSGESAWFDAKRDPYGNSEGDRRELAADVAAFANRQGGVILIGANDTAGVITSLTPISDSQLATEELRTQQIVASLIAPVPFVTVRRVSSALGGGYLLVVVPSSVRRPHCVAVNAQSVKYPIREGTHTRYLSESEIADQYRSRFADAASHVALAEERHRSFGNLLNWSEMSWLGQFQRSVHGSRHDAGACNRPRPLENPGCQEHRCRRAIATRSMLRSPRAATPVGR